ncbi:MAG: hypothetical protein ACE5MK_05055, partial [Acidobacteriota bacterium]
AISWRTQRDGGAHVRTAHGPARREAHGAGLEILHIIREQANDALTLIDVFNAQEKQSESQRRKRDSVLYGLNFLHDLTLIRQ